MPFIPKSQYVKQYTNGGQFVYKAKKTREYKGPYIIYNKKYFIGNDSFDMGAEIILDPKKQKGRNPKKEGYSSHARRYKILKPKIKNNLTSTLPIPSAKPSPKYEDYQKGSFRRYFCKRINGHNYIEISQKVFNELNQHTFKYDHNLYEIGSILWYISGPNLHSRNSTQIQKLERNYPHLLTLFPVLNEHALKASNIIQENLNTDGGELYYSDGTEYIGEYHIHPEQGPMVGATHSNQPHDNLYYFNSLPQYPNSSYQEFVENYNKIDCYRCIPNKDPNDSSSFMIIKTAGYRPAGCVGDTYPTSGEAINSCPPIDNLEEGRETFNGGGGISGGGGTSGGGGGGY